MRESAIFPVLVNFEIPNDSREKDDRRFDEEVALLLHPRLVEVEHDGVGTFVSVGYILHEVGVYGITAVRPSRVVEIDYIEFRLHCVSIQVVQQVVIGDG